MRFVAGSWSTSKAVTRTVAAQERRGRGLRSLGRASAA